MIQRILPLLIVVLACESSSKPPAPETNQGALEAEPAAQPEPTAEPAPTEAAEGTTDVSGTPDPDEQEPADEAASDFDEE